MDCNFTSPDTIQYINFKGEYVLKCKGWKKSRKYNIQLEKKSTSQVREKNIQERERLNKSLNDLIIQFKQNFLKRLKSNTPSIQNQKEELRKKIEYIINSLKIIDYELNEIGKIKPKKFIYTRKLSS